MIRSISGFEGDAVEFVDWRRDSRNVMSACKLSVRHSSSGIKDERYAVKRSDWICEMSDGLVMVRVFEVEICVDLRAFQEFSTVQKSSANVSIPNR